MLRDVHSQSGTLPPLIEGVGSWEELKRGVRMDREGEEVQDPISEF
jgi:hypothetical protein